MGGGGARALRVDPQSAEEQPGEEERGGAGYCTRATARRVAAARIGSGSAAGAGGAGAPTTVATRVSVEGTVGAPRSGSRSAIARSRLRSSGPASRRATALGADALRVVGPPAAMEGEHQLGEQPLAPRMGEHQLLEPADERGRDA